jgi:hypothetical protein
VASIVPEPSHRPGELDLVSLTQANLTQDPAVHWGQNREAPAGLGRIGSIESNPVNELEAFDDESAALNAQP